MKARYIFGVEDIPLQRWIGSNLIAVKTKSQSTLEKLKLQFGMRHIDAQGWLKVTHVLDNGVAQAAGLAAGDLLASIDGQRVTSARWDRVLGSLSENLHTRITFYRDDLEHERIVSMQSAQMPMQYELTPKKDV
jgi:predicted metalloprotease with PDZ domain